MPRHISQGHLRQEVRRFDPGRSPQWGWQFALRCMRTGERPLERFDGYWSCEAARLVRASGLSEENQDFALTTRHRRQWHAIREAYHLWQTDGPQRWAVEARILAKQSDAEIAAAEQLSEDTVAGYEALFFQVRDKLRARSWINNYVLQLGTQWTGRDVAKVWSFFGFNAGSVVMQVLIDDLVASGKGNYDYLDTGWFTDFPPTCKERWLYWNIQSLLLPPILSKERTLQLSELNMRLMNAESLTSEVKTCSVSEPLDLQLTATANPIGLRAAVQVS